MIIFMTILKLYLNKYLLVKIRVGEKIFENEKCLNRFKYSHHNTNSLKMRTYIVSENSIWKLKKIAYKAISS